jgi:alkylhydroperoxidase family enzyme
MTATPAAAPVAPSITSMEWGDCIVQPTAAPPALREETRQAFGTVPGWLPRLAPSPWLVRALCRLMSNPVAHAPPRLCDLIVLVVTQDNSCRYCYGIQHAFLRVLGYSREYLARLERDFHLAGLSPAESAALGFARKLSRSNPRPTPSDHAELVRAGLGRATIAEVAFVAAAATFANRVATLLALPPDTALESIVERPLFWLLRPLLAWRLRSRPRRTPSLPQSSDGPCAAVVAALEGSPSATALRRTIDEAWASEVLPHRTKTLMLAVIGRALGCSRSEHEARSLLEAEGVGARMLDDVLTNLASPMLDAREVRLIPFARETTHYQVPAIQRRMRDLSQGLSPVEVLETVGIIALANAVCRLSVLLDAP